ncbi:MAG TPA: TolC family protein [Pirellulales bacterium]|jgi:cobalt-zinc-cadmium efflux system outer membrane protein|nr:TolC family protein [Pirellulales bacterium]
MRWIVAHLIVSLAVMVSSRAARAQGPAELPLFERPESLFGPEIGASGTSAIEGSPGGREGMVGGRAGSAAGRIPLSVAQPGGWNRLSQPLEILPTPGLRAAEAPAYGSLEIPTHIEEEGPPHGLTLDKSIELLLRENLDLRAKALELPQADADILTAGLRANPLMFMDSQLVPYGEYNPTTNPGGQTQYDVNMSLPVDVTRKRQARTVVAVQAKRVLDAQYQDAVRQAIDNLYTAYVDVLAARETVRFASASVAGLDKLLQATQAQQQQTQKTQAEVNQMLIQRDAAALGLLEAETALGNAKHTLAAMLNSPPATALQLEVRGTLHDAAPAPPEVDQLLPLAVSIRPDMMAYRLGIGRAEADVKLARASWMQDVYIFYQPFTLQDNRFTGTGASNSISWAAGMTMNVPLFDRNQGNIRRARVNVRQTQLEMLALERAIATEVQQAHVAYKTTKIAIERLEKTLLPAARQVLDTNLRLYQQGEANMFNYLAAQREYNELVRQYRDTLVDHRRAMLKLNSAVGQRLLP